MYHRQYRRGMVLGNYILYLRRPRLIREVLSRWDDEVLHALVPELPHVDLQREQREHHQAEDGQRHYLRELLERVQQRVDDGF